MSKDAMYRRLLGSKRWAYLARSMKVRAGWQCQRCGCVSQRLAVHHVRPVETARNEKEMEELCFDESNLQVLCYSCHKLVHQQERYSTKDVMQERARQRVERFIEMYTNDGDDAGSVETGE